MLELFISLKNQQPSVRVIYFIVVVVVVKFVY